jgi:hypothetical protein
VVLEQQTRRRGRPRNSESRERRKRFVALVLAGTPFTQAAVDARVAPLRALAIIDELAAAGMILRPPSD